MAQSDRATVCFLDLDGVLVDLVPSVLDFYSLPWPYDNVKNKGIWDLSSIYPEIRWQDLPVEFWAQLPKTREAEKILQLVESVFGDNVCLLSNPSGPKSAMGKSIWIENNMPKYRERSLLGKPKFFCASRRSMLIDDCDENVILFTAHNGSAILVPRVWNTLHEIPTLVYLESRMYYEGFTY